MENENKTDKLFGEFPPVSTPAWEQKIHADLKGADYEKKLVWKTEDGFDVRPYYRSEDLKGKEYLDVNPGEVPYVRGTRHNDNGWTIREDILTEDIEEANRLALDALARGADTVGFRVKEITSHKQMNQLLANIDLVKNPVNFISSRSYPLTLELFIYEIGNRGLDTNKITGSLNFDPFSYLLIHGDFYISMENNLDEAEYLIDTIQKRLPNMKGITVNGQLFHNSGATLGQELAFSMASAHEYLNGLISKGMLADSVAPRIMFSFGTGSNYFFEIAKYRAARLLWAKIVEQYNPQKEDSLKTFIHAGTSVWNKTVYDPYVNMLRTTTEGMSAAIGNVDSLTIHPFDVTFQGSDDFSRRIARNQQQIMKEESYLDKVVDPGAGSYYIETLTDSIASHAWDLFLQVEEKGGFIECIRSGFIQDEIEKSRLKMESDLAQRKMIQIGMNQYPELHEMMLDSMRNEIPLSKEEKHSNYKKLRPSRASVAFEKVRLATERHVKAGNRKPVVFLLTIGTLAMRRARAQFATNFFGCAGYSIIDTAGFTTPEEGVSEALKTGADIVVVCSSDDEYLQVLPAISAGIKKEQPGVKVIVAGYPRELIELLKEAGADDFIHIRSNVLETLEKYQVYFGIL